MILVLPSFEVSIIEIHKKLKKLISQFKIEDTKKQRATTEYSINHSKFIFHDDCAIDLNDVKRQFKKGWVSLGNGITKTSINGIPCIYLVLKGGSIHSKDIIQKVFQLFAQEEIKRSQN